MVCRLDMKDHIYVMALVGLVFRKATSSADHVAVNLMMVWCWYKLARTPAGLLHHGSILQCHQFTSTTLEVLCLGL